VSFGSTSDGATRASADSAARMRSARRADSLVVRLRNDSIVPVPPSRTITSNTSAGAIPRRSATAIRFGSVVAFLSMRTRTWLPHAPADAASSARLATAKVARAALPPCVV
jgi:hypothetical protein